MQYNIVLDFTANKSLESLTAGQPLAIMPAVLAKKLLHDFAAKLYNATLEEIIVAHYQDLMRCKTMDQVLATSVSFLQERELIDAVMNEDWDRYAAESATIESASDSDLEDLGYHANEAARERQNRN